MKCSKCGNEIANDSLFCEFCGAKLDLAHSKPLELRKACIYNRAYLFMFVSLFIMSATFCVSTECVYWLLKWPYVIWCVLLSGCNVYYVNNNKITRHFGNFCWVQLFIVIAVLLCIIFGEYRYVIFYRLYYLPIISFIVCFSIYGHKYKNRSGLVENDEASTANNEVTSNNSCLVPVQWLLFIVALLVCAGNFICLAVAVETDTVNYFEYFGWIIPALSCALFLGSFILSSNKKISVVNSLIIGLLLALNCYILESNKYKDTLTDYARTSVIILKNGYNIGYISKHDNSWSRSNECKSEEEDLKALINSFGNDYSAGNVSKHWMYYYNAKNTTIVLFVEALILLIYLLSIIIELRKKNSHEVPELR